MTWTARYIPPSLSNWQGRNDIPQASCFYQNIQLYDLNKSLKPLPQTAFALIGFTCDQGIARNLGRQGAASGPQILRQTLAKLALHRHDLMVCDLGDITCKDGDLEAAQSALSEVIFLLLEHQFIPIVIGGGHELAWGHYQGIAKAFPKNDLGIINFDAHFDMRPLLENNQGSSGTPFLQIAHAHQQANKRLNYNCIGIQPAANIDLLFETAKKFKVNSIDAYTVQQNQGLAALKLIDSVIQDSESIYLSLCLDVFASAYAPGVSAPQILGLTPWQVLPLIRKLANSKKVLSYDIAELSPEYDIDLRTAKLAANLIYEIIHHHLI